MKFVHTADWQSVTATDRFDPNARAALIETRLDTIDTICVDPSLGTLDQQLFYCDDARLDLMIEIEAE